MYVLHFAVVDAMGAGFGSEYHYIFECRVFDAERTVLSQHMDVDLSWISWNVFWAILGDNSHLLHLFLTLFLGSVRF